MSGLPITYFSCMSLKKIMIIIKKWFCCIRYYICLLNIFCILYDNFVVSISIQMQIYQENIYNYWLHTYLLVYLYLWITYLSNVKANENLPFLLCKKYKNLRWDRPSEFHSYCQFSPYYMHIWVFYVIYLTQWKITIPQVLVPFSSFKIEGTSSGDIVPSVLLSFFQNTFYIPLAPKFLTFFWSHSYFLSFKHHQKNSAATQKCHSFLIQPIFSGI